MNRRLTDFAFAVCLVLGSFSYKAHKALRSLRQKIYWHSIKNDDTNRVTRTVRFLNKTQGP